MLRRIFSVIMFILLVTSILSLEFNIQFVKATGNTQTRGEVSVTPPTIPVVRNKDDYTLKDNSFVSASSVSTATVSNAILEAAIQTQTTGSGVGTYTIRTGQNHPKPFENVLFGGAALDPWSSYNTVKVYDTNKEYATSASASLLPDPGFSLVALDNCNPTTDIQSSTVVRIHWDTPENLRIYQEVGVLGTNMSDTHVYVSMWVHNYDAVTHTVGFRFLADLMISNWDGSWLRPEAAGPWLDTETEWTPPNFDFWETTNYPLQPAFYINGLYWPTPTKMTFAYWGSSFERAYLYTPTGRVIGSPIPNIGGSEDSAVLHYWDPIQVTPGGEAAVNGDIPNPTRRDPPYDVTIRGYCNTEGTEVNVHIVMDGSPTGYTTPHTFTNMNGTHTFTVTITDPNSHPFWQWATGETTATITVSFGGTYTARYGAHVYDVMIKGHCEVESVDVSVSIMMDGSPTGYVTPHTFYGLDGTHTFIVPDVDSNAHMFWRWGGDGTSTTIAVSLGGTYTAYYGPQPYDVTVLGHCNTEGTDVSVSIMMDGSPTGYVTPHTFYGLDGTHTFTLPSYDTISHPFARWNTGETSRTITVNFAGIYLGYYEAPPVGIHDVAILKVTTSKADCPPMPTVGQNYTAEINVTVRNKGGFAEIFNVTLFANQGLLSYWKFDEGSGTTAYDSSGNGNNGAVYGAAWVDGEYAKALSFNGVGDSVQVPDSSLWDFGTGDFTMSAWINTGDQTKTMRIVSAGYGTTETVGSFLWTLGFGNNLGWGPGTRINYATKSGGYYRNYQSNELTYSNNEWAHVAVVKSGSTLNFYFNGIGAGSESIAFPSDSNSYLTMGARQSDDSGVLIEFFDGLIDEVKILNRSLSAEEVQTEYAQPSCTKLVTLESGASATFTFVWNTTGYAYGNYTIGAYAWPVQGETNLQDNLMVDAIVYVGVPGDINGDGIVDIYDAILLANAYNSTPEKVKWNPNADINGDNIVDIYDAIILANHYNQHYP